MTNAKEQKELQLLFRIIETISYTLDIDAVLREIIHVVDSVAHADEIFIYLLRDNELLCRAALNTIPEELNQIHLPLGMGITGWVAQHRTPVILSERAYNDKRFHLFTNLKADQYEAFLSLPLVHHDKLIGVFNVQHKNTYTFTEEEIQLLQTIAYATAGAIENARLFAHATELSEALIAHKLVDRAKGKIMDQLHYNEEEAYQFLKRRAMRSRKPMRAIAEAVLLTFDQ